MRPVFIWWLIQNERQNTQQITEIIWEAMLVLSKDNFYSFNPIYGLNH